MAAARKNTGLTVAFTGFQYLVCFILTVLSLLPFIIMLVNATRSSSSIQANAISFIPGKALLTNYKVFDGKSFNPWTGFINSAIISVCATACTIYFSTLTAYTLVAYDWKAKKAFFALIMCILMIPGQVTAIGSGDEGIYAGTDSDGGDIILGWTNADDFINANT